jgi:hypothetical protein
MESYPRAAVEVSETALPYGLRLLDALFMAANEASHRRDWLKPYDTQLKIIDLEEKLILSLTEKVNRNEHKPSYRASAYEPAV